MRKRIVGKGVPKARLGIPAIRIFRQNGMERQKVALAVEGLLVRKLPPISTSVKLRFTKKATARPDSARLPGCR